MHTFYAVLGKQFSSSIVFGTKSQDMYKSDLQTKVISTVAMVKTLALEQHYKAISEGLHFCHFYFHSVLVHTGYCGSETFLQLSTCT